jgi:hypothetical protein
MAYQVYYPTGCNTAVPDHFCSDCPTREHGRVRAVAFIKDTFEFTDPTNPLEWQAGIAAKDIIIINKVNGTFDGGSEVEGPGYGDQASTLFGYNFVAVFNDPNYEFNADFYNALKRSSNWRFAYKTENFVHLTTKTVSVVPKNPVTDDINSDVVWNVTVKWAEEDLPIPYTTPAGVFVCLDYTGSIV